MKLHLNYQYILDKSLSLLSEGGRILDYGCGKGLLVEEGKNRGITIYGCELFGPGSGVKIRKELGQKGLLGNRVREITNGLIPFPDDYFDLVVSNQVFEHVPELDPVIGEIARVLNHNGKLLCLFPSHEAIRDHAGTLFAHWLPNNSRIQYYSLLAFRTAGFGRLKGRRTHREWARFFVQWLDDNTFYRGKKEIHNTISQYFATVQHIEEDYVAFRLGAKGLHRLERFELI